LHLRELAKSAVSKFLLKVDLARVEKVATVI